MRKVLKAIFFDLDDTLFSTREFAKLARTNALSNMRKHGLKPDHNELYSQLLEVINEFSVNYDKHFDKLLLRLPKNSYSGVNPAILIAAAIVSYHDTKFKHLIPYKDALDFLKRIKRTKLIKGIITAGLAIKQAEKLLRLDLYNYFDKHAIFITDQIGISKPNPKLFTHVCSSLKLKPHECMYIGNSVKNDIIPSKTAGFYTVLLNRDKTESDIIPHFTISRFSELTKIIRENFAI
ncbi:MAG: TIGR02253 family HAD-type hydrolase [Planctomycetes bacterium]|nr:TIGR02253 family HAD-type hydrolase [Planctomycetota bacterium]